jgi:hypothetical protein
LGSPAPNSARGEGGDGGSVHAGSCREGTWKLPRAWLALRPALPAALLLLVVLAVVGGGRAWRRAGQQAGAGQQHFAHWGAAGVAVANSGDHQPSCPAGAKPPMLNEISFG